MVDHYNENIQYAELSQEMRNSFLDYAMSVIVSRALPDVRDGLKPVHRRILYGMNELGITPDKGYKKSARIVGDVMGKYHPHGDSAIYESMVRMAQDFSFRYELIDGHGNFGSVDGDGAAAMRYTEARMSKISLEMLRDINKNTVDFQDNYDGEEREPEVLPARFPNLLVNGASGIAVGMATNIPPHNLGETIDAAIMLLHNPDAEIQDLMEAVPGPDFPTGGTVLGKSGIRKAYETGRGSIILRAKARIEVLETGRELIIVDEIPYQVNKAKMIEKIAELVRDKMIDGITELRDESDQNGMRIVIGVRRDTSAGVVLNNLYKQTQMQTSFGFNMLAIVDGVPKTLSLKQILEEYLKHQRQVVERRTRFDKQKAENRAHILAGLRIALDNINEIIRIIRSSEESSVAKQTLIERFELSDKQAQSILDMRLVRLTGLERDKINNEYDEKMELIRDLTDILNRPERIDQIIDEELTEVKQKYGDERRTELMVGEVLSLEDEDLIEEEEITILLTEDGYVKRMPSEEFKSQHRGGRGVKGISTHDEDYVSQILTCSTHDLILSFTNKGKIYRVKGYEIPEYGRSAKGLPIINIMNIGSDESIEAMVSLEDKPQGDEHLFFVTKNGTVKRTLLEEFRNIRTSGIIAIKLNEDDELIDVFVTQGDDNIIIGTQQGYAVSFSETDVRSMGRNTTGVRGANLREGDQVIGASTLPEASDVLVVSEKGYGKRTKAEEYPVRGRGGKGIITLNVTDKNGPLKALMTVEGEEDILLMTSEGIMIRFEVGNVSTTGRATQGVRLVRMDEGVYVTTAEKLIESSEDDEENSANEVE